MMMLFLLFVNVDILGCDMKYGPGASVAIWKDILLPTDELWEAEFDRACVEKAQKNKQLEGVNVLVGDQGDPEVLASWLQKSGNNFDVIIDDGGTFHVIHRALYANFAIDGEI